MDENEKNMFNENNESSGAENNTNDVNFVLPSYEESKPKKQRKRKTFFGYIAVALISSLIGGLAGGYIATSQINITDKNSGGTLTAQDVNINLTDDVYFAAAVAKKSQKSVVGITTDVVHQYNTFFGPQTQKSQSMGSGFIVDYN